MRCLSRLALVLIVLSAFGCGDDDVAPTDGAVMRVDAGGAPRDSGGGAVPDSGGMTPDSSGATPDSGGAPPDSGSGGGSDAGSVDPRCVSGCVLAVMADCTMGPPSQPECERGCQMLLTGPCATQMTAYMTCGEGRPVSCNAEGRVAIAGCSAEQAALETCASM